MLDIVIIIACSLCGFAVGKYLEKRIRNKNSFFVDLNKYIASFRINVDGRQLERDLFNAEFSESCGDGFREYLKGGKLKCKLSAPEQKEIKDFFENLGEVSSVELKKNLDYYSYVFSEKSKLIAEQSNKASVYVKLGILLGVMAGILLI